MTRLRQKQPRLKLRREEYEGLRRRVLERDGWRCQSCGSSMELQIHHVKSRSKLGDDALYNLITLCASCHGMRHGKAHYVGLRSAKHYSHLRLKDRLPGRASQARAEREFKKAMAVDSSTININAGSSEKLPSG